jgi:inner membrane protein
MLIRTHLAIIILAILFFITAVENKIIFVAMALIATFLPDIDSVYSSFGRYRIFRFFQIFVKHRGFFHSFTFLFLITLFFVLFFPVVSLGFFLGYALHLFADSFTIEGIKPFWPFSKKYIQGKIRTGKLFETGLFIGFVIADLLLLILEVI